MIKITNIRVIHNYARLRADIETTTGKGWIEERFDGERGGDEVTSGEIDADELNNAHTALKQFYEQTLKQHYTAMITILNDVCKENKIVIPKKIISATYIAIWNNTSKTESPCKINAETKEVFNIENIAVSDLNSDVCTGEFVEIDDELFDVFTANTVNPTSDSSTNKFWRK